MKKQLLLLSVVLLLLGASVTFAAGPIKIGAFYSLSGIAEAIGTPTRLVTRMVVEKINKEGGINGRHIDLVEEDAESNPEKAQRVVKKFIHVDKVAAIIGPDRTDLGMAVKKLVENAGIPTFMTVGGDSVIMGGEKFGPYKWVFKSPQRCSTAVEKLFSHLKKHGLTKIGIIVASSTFGKAGKDWLEKLGPKFGVTIVAREVFQSHRH